MVASVADNLFKENFGILLIQISPTYAHRGQIDNESTLLQVMAWQRTGAGLALDIFKMGSWDPSTFGKWGPV